MLALVDALSRCNVTMCKSTKIKRVAVSAFDGECLILVELASDVLGLLLLLAELLQGKHASLLETALYSRPCDARSAVDPRSRMPAQLFSDSEGVINATYGTKAVDCKRRAGDIAQLREAVELQDFDAINHVAGDSNPTDPLTKERSSKTAATEALLLAALYEGTLAIPLQTWS
jgi:hypothetical protein